MTVSDAKLAHRGYPLLITGMLLLCEHGFQQANLNSTAFAVTQESPRPAVDSRGESGIVAAAGRHKAGVVLLGIPGGGQATGFVISREHRLIATAAHVADHASEGTQAMLAIPEGQFQPYQIERVWYHPATVRKLDEGFYARTPDPKDGEFWLGAPDVAVLKLTSQGPELPDALELASREELLDREPRPIVSIGYPGRIEDRWPEKSRPAKATVVAGVTQKMTDRLDTPDLPFEKRQCLRYTPELEGGLSGGPIVLTNGHVLAIASSAVDVIETGEAVSVGCRIDCLQELLSYHHLMEAGAKDRRDVAVHSDWGPDPQIDQFRRAVRLIREADQLRQRGDFLAASQLCNEAISLAPRYSGAYFQRGKVYLYYCGRYWNELTAEEKSRYSEWASLDSLKAINTHEYLYIYYVFNIQINVYLSVARNSRKLLKETAQTVDEYLGRSGPYDSFDNDEKSFLLNCRAQCHQFLGEFDAAIKDFEESIRLKPDEAQWYLNRAQCWGQMGLNDRLRQDQEMAQSLKAARSGFLRARAVCSRTADDGIMEMEGNGRGRSWQRSRRLLPCVPTRWICGSGSRRRSMRETALSDRSRVGSASASRSSLVS